MAVSTADEITFSHWVKRRRKALDLTQDALAQRAGCSVQTLQKIEQGVRRPSRALAVRLADALDIPPNERVRFLQFARSEPAAPATPAAPESAPRLALPRPTPLVDLIGRAAEHAALVARLRDGGQRLVTLVGPGGIGKTSLAIQVAADLAADSAFADGAAVALLASVVAASDVALAVAAALDVMLQGALPAEDQLLEALRDRQLLLVLDNVEHLLGPGEGATLARLISRVLGEAPGVRMLVTSRERLRMRDERLMELGGLALPTTERGTGVDRAESVRLFVERAQRVVPDFALNAENRAAVAHICRRLEGMPLAIELAAAWTRALTPGEIAAEIDRSLDFLAGVDRDLPDRHRSMRAALDHSWQLLTDPERAVLARLSVFHGGWDRDAAASIAGATLPLIISLIDKSLLRPTAARGHTRYMLHELVRQYAAERLAEDPDTQRAVERRHTAFYADLLQRSIAAQTGGSSPEDWATLTRNIDNVRAAWLRAAAVGDAATLLAMVRSLNILYDVNGWVHEAVTLFERGARNLGAVGTEASIARGTILGWQGYFLIRTGRPAAAAPLLEEGVSNVRAAGSTEGLAHLLLHRGSVELYAARFDAARDWYARAAQLAEATGDHFTGLWVTFMQGNAALFTGDLLTAERNFTICRDVWRSLSFSRGIVASLLLLGETARVGGRLAAAEALVRECLQIASGIRDVPTITMCMRELGALALERGELDEAAYLLSESYAGMRALGDLIYASRCRSLLVRLEVQRGDYAAARQGCAGLLGVVPRGADILLADVAYGLALVLAAEGSDVEALAVSMALAGIAGEYDTLQRAARLRAELERRLAPAQRAAAAEQARDRQLLPWLEELCARQSSPVAGQSTAPPFEGTPIVPPGGLLVRETGAILSPRECDVLRLLIAGASNQAIADTLIISLHTAKKHVASILHKLDVATRTQAALRGRALGLTPLSPQ